MKIQGTPLVKIKMIFLLTTFFLVALSFFVFIQIKKLIDSSNLVNHTNTTTIALQKIASFMIDAESSQRGFLLSGDTLLLEKRDASFKALEAQLELVNDLIKDNPQQIENLQSLHLTIDKKRASMYGVLKDYRPMDLVPDFRNRIVDGVVKMDSVKDHISRMSASERNLLNSRTQKYSRLSILTPIFMILLFLGALFILLVSYFRIINELKHSKDLQAKLEEEKALAQTILDSSPDNIIVLDKDLRYISANRNAEKTILKYTNDYIGKKTTDIFPNSQTTNDMQKALTGETLYYKDYYSAAINLHLEVRYTPLRKGNEIIGLIGQSRDISGILATNTQLAKQNEELEDRNTFVETLINSSVDLIHVVGPDLRYIKINKMAEEVLRKISNENVIGKKVADVDTTAPLKELKQALNGKTIVVNKFKPFGVDKYYEVSYIPLKKKNEIYAVMIISHDITESIIIEEEIRALNQAFNYAEQVGMFGSYRYNLVTKEIIYSDNLYRLLGCVPQEFAATIDNLMQFIEPEDRQFALNPITETFSLKHASRREYRINRSDARIIYLRETGKTITDEEGVKWMIGTLQDITEEKHQQQHLNKTNEDLEKMNKELQSFAYISSHDLQEPLRKIQTFASRIIDSEMQTLSERGKEHFKRIQAAAQRMQALIEDLLSFSSTSSEEHKFEITDVSKLINGVIDDFKDDLIQQHATVELTGTCSLNVIPFQIIQLFHNLIGNALKFTNPGHPQNVHITLEIIKDSEQGLVKLPEGKNYCHIIVRDNGIGFDPSYSEKIFEVFQRLHGREQYKGTGIGLAIVKKIVDNHKGVITAFGEPQKGATFHIYLPAIS